MIAGYSDLVVDHFEQPRNSGRLDAASDVIEASAGSRADGAQFCLSARIRDDQIAEMRFQVFGCPHSIAAASWLTGHFIGARREQLVQWHWRDIATLLDVPTAKRGRLLILEDAVHALAEKWREKAQTAPW